MRLDQWLWAMRLFKTRALAVEAIKGGHVKIKGEATKPAHQVRAGEIITVQMGVMTRTLRVVDIPKSRVGAKLVPLYSDDLTPPEEFEKQRAFNLHLNQPGARPRGAGRPTKRERRTLDGLAEEQFGDG